jgi:hypothetical protein
MRIKIFYFLLLLIIPLACGNGHLSNMNQTINDEAYIKATINGVEYLFDDEDYLLALNGPTPDGRFGLTITGNVPEDTDAASVAISIIIFSKTDIQQGLYTNGEFVEYGYFGPLFIGPQLGFISQANMQMWVTDVNNPQSVVDILELTETGVKATFSGTLVNPVNKSTTTITNGELFVKF